MKFLVHARQPDYAEINGKLISKQGEPFGHGWILDLPDSLPEFLAIMAGDRFMRFNVMPPGSPPWQHPEYYTIAIQNDYD